ncbi:MAG: hypothetical protein ACFE95_13035 [Candidatus Hodarchaeota archaeon]
MQINRNREWKKEKRIFFCVFLFIFTLIVINAVSLGRAVFLITTEYRVTSSVEYETNPRLGNDGVSDIVVYTKRMLLPNGNLGPGDIWYQ